VAGLNNAGQIFFEESKPERLAFSLRRRRSPLIHLK
jgi:hypothetical protein